MKDPQACAVFLAASLRGEVRTRTADCGHDVWPQPGLRRGSGHEFAEGRTVNAVAVAVLAFNRWAKDTLPISNSIMAMDVLLGVYLKEREGREPTTFKELCWDLRYSEQAIRMIVNRLEEASWIVLEQDERFRRSISRLRIPPENAAILEQGLRLLHSAAQAKG